MKTKIILPLLLAFFIFSCSENDETNELQQKQDLELDNLGEAVGSAFESLRINFNQPITYHYSNLEERDSIIRTIIKDIYEVELHSGVNGNGETTSDEFAVNIVINELTNTLVLTPEPVIQVIGGNTTYGDDNKDCGGKAGDGWKSYGTCQSEDCVKKKSEDAVAALSSSLTSGKCLDIRIKRNMLSARVCARLIDC